MLYLTQFYIVLDLKKIQMQIPTTRVHSPLMNTSAQTPYSYSCIQKTGPVTTNKRIIL